jgi:hypothetical protein
VRPWLLLLLLPIASANDDAAPVGSGEWSLAVFLEFDSNGVGAWGDAKAGAMARFEIVHTPGGVVPDLVGGGGRTKKKAPQVSEREYRVAKGDGGKLVLRTRERPPDERGKPGSWGKTVTLDLPVIDVAMWKVERLGDTEYRFGAHSVAATTYRVRLPGPAGAGDDEWLVAVGKELGVLRARRETGNAVEWSLAATDVDLKVGGRKVRCREYEYKRTPPPELKVIGITERRMFLSAEVPGRVVRQTYSGFLGASTREHLVSFAG